MSVRPLVERSTGKFGTVISDDLLGHPAHLTQPFQDPYHALAGQRGVDSK
jgi:hypothetical protein